MPTTINGTTGVSQVQDGIVTSAKVVDGTLTGADLSGAQTGSAPIYGARAWCVFNGTTTGTNPPLAGGNVTSVTRNSVGNYTINFTTAMVDTNFAFIGSCSSLFGGVGFVSSTTSSVTISTSNSGSTATDYNPIAVAIFR